MFEVVVVWSEMVGGVEVVVESEVVAVFESEAEASERAQQEAWDMEYMDGLWEVSVRAAA